MRDQDAIAGIFGALVEQTKAIRDLKIQVESLKQMIFEHRPAFIPAFEEQVRKTSATPSVQQLDSTIGQLELAVRSLHEE
jgi:hypothetical protein